MGIRIRLAPPPQIALIQRRGVLFRETIGYFYYHLSKKLQVICVIMNAKLLYDFGRNLEYYLLTKMLFVQYQRRTSHLLLDFP